MDKGRAAGFLATANEICMPSVDWKVFSLSLRY